MICPLDHSMLVDYWAGELGERETLEIDEHLFGCDTCFEAAQRVAALAEALRRALPVVVLERDLERARAAGVRFVMHDVRPGVPKEALFQRGNDIVVHRLLVEDLPRFEKVSIALTTLDGTTFDEYQDVPFDRGERAVLVACQRHLAELAPTADMRLVVRGVDAEGREATESFTVLHRYE